MSTDDRVRDDEGGLEPTEATRVSGGEVLGIDRSAKLASRYWWVLLAAGIVGVIFGLIMLFNVAGGLRLLAFLAGFYLLFTGAIELVNSASSKPRWLAIVAGLLAIVGGIIAIAYPGLTLAALAVIVGASFVAWGVVKALAALSARADGWGWSAAGGALLAVVGIVTIAYPKATIFVISVLIGINALIFGISAIAQSFALRHADSD